MHQLRDPDDRVAQQGGVGGLQGYVRPATHCNAHVTLSERRSIIDAVPDHRHLAGSLQGGDPLEFVFRQQLGLHVQAQVTCDGVAGAGVVAREHQRAHTKTFEPGHRLFRVRSRLVPNGEQTEHLAAVEHHHHRFALLLQPGDLRLLVRTQRGHFHGVARGPHREGTALHRGSHGLARDGLGVLSSGDGLPLGTGEDRLGERVGAPRLHGGGEQDDLLFWSAQADHVRHLGLVLGQRAGLVEGDRRDTADGLQRGTALDQQAAPGTRRDAAGHGSRDAQHQGTGAGDQQQGHTFVDPFVPGLAEQQRWEDSEQEGHGHRRRGVPAGEAVDEARGGGFGGLRLFDQVDDPGDGVVGSPSLHPDGQHPVGVDAARVDRIAGALVDGHALAGHRGVVEVGVALGDGAVRRDPATRLDPHELADLKPLDGHLAGLTTFEQQGGLGSQRRERLNPCPRPPGRDVLQQFADGEEEDDECPFRRLPDGDGADGGHADQGVDGEGLPQAGTGDGLAEERPGADGGCGRVRPEGEPRRDQAEQQGEDEQPTREQDVAALARLIPGEFDPGRTGSDRSG